MSTTGSGSDQPTGESIVHAIDEAITAALVTYAEHLGVDPTDLDETVYEIANAAAAQSYNDGALPELGDEGAYEQLHDDADGAASDINNGGLPAQVAFLHSRQSAAAVRNLIELAAAG